MAAAKRGARSKAAAVAIEAPAPKKIRINPVVRRYPIDVQGSSRVLQNAIGEIFRRSNASGLSFEELYRHAFNLCQGNHAAKLYQMFREELIRNLAVYRDGVFAAADTGSMFEVLDEKWLEFSRALQLIRALLSCMDRTYVIRYRERSVYDLGLELWKVEVVSSPKLQAALTAFLLGEIHKERSGEMIDRSKMRRAVQMLIELDYKIYLLVVEEPFISASKDFYSIESQQLLACGDCSAMLKRVERRLKEESMRVSRYLSEKTGPKISRVVVDIFVGKNIKQLVDMENTGLEFMLSQDRLDDLARMYEFLQHWEEGGKEILDGLTRHIKANGAQLVQDPERQKDPVAFIQLLLSFKEKYDAIVSSSFKRNKAVAAGLEVAFAEVVNLNRRLPEFLSLFLDNKLRQGGKSDSGGSDDPEAFMDKAMLIFRYINEKDMFEKYYKHHLAKRLLLSKFAEDELERSLILKIKTVCGYQFTSKIETMLKDMRTSEDLMQRFRNMQANINAAVNINVQVLTTGSWPAYASSSQCILPREVHGLCERFKTFYLMQHRGRRLTWQGNLGSADLKLTIDDTTKTLSCSTYQMCILMLFNDSDRLSYKEIKDATGIQQASELKRNLQSLALVRGKNVLRKEPMSKEIGETDVFVFNEAFTSKLAKIKICTVAAQKETGEENSRTRETIESDRNPQIEAAIVRVMKSRQRMEHNNLVSEVIAQLQSRFTPNPAVIKKRIEALIERDYLERDRDDRRTYCYLA
ncbi:hypothetical protein SELMODRAFT_98222 [Selaginella moellendorffii]|uniref:Cullin family profile domain-containing protein n=2 Tax=Selaginella moellendorffii TaxID=88036 RepID=D8RP10_SELML|nr:hypothetical protein SELMODRAFT_98222 [Selaginella moellendorffii]